MESSGSPSMSGATIYLSSSTTSGDGGAGGATRVKTRSSPRSGLPPREILRVSSQYVVSNAEPSRPVAAKAALAALAISGTS